MPLLSTLTEKTAPLAGTEETYLDDSATDKRTKLSTILAYIVANFGAVFNRVTITAPASSATLTIANGKTLTVNNTVTLAGTDGNTHTLPSTNSTTLASLTGVETLTNKTLTSPTMTAPVLGAATGTSLALSGAATAATASATGTVTAQSATATPAPASMVAAFAMGTAGIGIFWGSGAPTGSAAKGSLYINTSGSSTSTRLYVNTDGATTWTNVTTAA